MFDTPSKHPPTDTVKRDQRPAHRLHRRQPTAAPMSC